MPSLRLTLSAVRTTFKFVARVRCQRTNTDGTLRASLQVTRQALLHTHWARTVAQLKLNFPCIHFELSYRHGRGQGSGNLHHEVGIHTFCNESPVARHAHCTSSSSATL
jgi:hypothetical protein